MLKERICVLTIVLALIGISNEKCSAENLISTNDLCNTHMEIINMESNYDEINWQTLVDKANEEAMSEWENSDSALEKDLKRNLDKWGNRGNEPLMIKNDSIFYRIYYSEQIFDAMNSLDNLKERLSEVFIYTKLYNSVSTLLITMSQHQKELYILMISNKKKRTKVVPFSADEYIQFGSKAK